MILRRTPRPSLAAAAALVLTAALMSCGGEGDDPSAKTAGSQSVSGPLAGVLTAPQITQLERAAVEQVNLGLATSTAGTSAKSIEQIKQACSALDTSVPLLAAFERTCAPSLAFFDAASGLAAGCLSSVGDECGDALDALNAEVAELSATTLRMHEAVAVAVKDPACREQLGGTTDQMAGVRALPKATADAAKAARASDPATQQESLTGLLTTLEQIGGELAPADYVAALRRDCGLPSTTPLATPQAPA